MLYLSIAIVVCIIAYLFYSYKNPYIDSIEKETSIIGKGNQIPVGNIILYKRTYKNGKVVYFEKKYMS